MSRVRPAEMRRKAKGSFTPFGRVGARREAMKPRGPGEMRGDLYSKAAQSVKVGAWPPAVLRAAGTRDGEAERGARTSTSLSLSVSLPLRQPARKKSRR